MKRAEMISRILKECDPAFVYISSDGREIVEVRTLKLHDFIKTLLKEEREACAEIAENWRCNGVPRTGVANEIRKRGKK